MGSIGRLLTVEKDGVIIAGIRTVSVSWASESIDLSQGEPDGYRLLAEIDGLETISLSVEGITKSDLIRNIAYSRAESRLLENITITWPVSEEGATPATLQGSFFISDYSEDAPYNDAYTFTLTLNSSALIQGGRLIIGGYIYQPEVNEVLAIGSSSTGTNARYYEYPNYNFLESNIPEFGTSAMRIRIVDEVSYFACSTGLNRVYRTDRNGYLLPQFSPGIPVAGDVDSAKDLGHLATTQTSTASLAIYDLKTSKELFNYLLSAAFTVKYSPDEQFLVYGGGIPRLRIYDTSASPYTDITGATIQPLSNVQDISFKPNMSHMALGTETLGVKVYSISGSTFTPISDPIGNITTERILRLQYSPDGSVLAVAYRNSDPVDLWDATTIPYVKLTQPIKSPSYQKYDVSWSGDGRVLTLVTDQEIINYDTSSIPYAEGNQIPEPGLLNFRSSDYGKITPLEVEEHLIISSTDGNYLTSLNPSNLGYIDDFDGVKSSAEDLIYSSDYIFELRSTGIIYANEKISGIYQDDGSFGSGVSCFDLDLSNNRLIAGKTSGPNYLSFFDLSTYAETTLLISGAAVTSVAASSDGSLFAVGNNLGVMEVDSDVEIGYVYSGPDVSNRGGFSPDGNSLCIGRQSTEGIFLFNTASSPWTALTLPASVPENCSDAKFNPEGSYLAVSSTSSDPIAIYDTSTNPYTRILDPDIVPSFGGVSIKWNNSGSLLALVSSAEEKVYIYNTSVIPFERISHGEPYNVGTPTGCVFD